MKTLTFRIARVDVYGFQGRDFHPRPEDVGLLVTPLHVQTFMDTPDGETLGADGGGLEPKRAAAMIGELNSGARCGVPWQVWTCATADGRVLELIGFEVELVAGLEVETRDDHAFVSDPNIDPAAERCDDCERPAAGHGAPFLSSREDVAQDLAAVDAFVARTVAGVASAVGVSVEDLTAPAPIAAAFDVFDAHAVITTEQREPIGDDVDGLTYHD